MTGHDAFGADEAGIINMAAAFRYGRADIL